MAVTKFYQTKSFSTGDVYFRQIITSIMTGLTAAGLIQTADTGQLNPLTVVFPGAINTDAGYLVYRFNDTLQATRPIFLKITIGRHSTATNFRITWQIGTSTNGAGTLGGYTTTNQTYGTADSDLLTNWPCFIAGDAGTGNGGWLTMCFYPGTATTSFFGLSISRSRNSVGAATGDGINFVTLATGFFRTQYIDFAVGFQFPVINFLVGVVPDTGVSSNFNFLGETPTFPQQPARPYLDYPDLGIVMYGQSDLATGITFKTEILGSQHTYWTVGSGYTTTHPNNAGVGFAMRYE